MPDSLPPLPPGPRWRSAWLPGLLLGLLALVVFAIGMPGEPEFPDEWAYVSQSYFLELLTQPDNALWLEYPAFDLPPLPKYAIGLALKAQGYRPPVPAAARRWYEDISTRSGNHAMLVAARWPSVLLGAVGCVSLYAIGEMVGGRPLGVAAGLLLMLDPLYRMQARRAMSDIYAEALMLAALAVGLAAWRCLLDRRRGLGAGVSRMLGSGVLAGLAVASKLNGGLALIVLGTWACLALVVPGTDWRRKVTVAAATALAGVVAYAVFVPLNPFLWSNPAARVSPALAPIAEMGRIDRTGYLITHRDAVSNQAREAFPRDALNTVVEKLQAVATQGFGRFGAFGRRRLVADIYEPDRRVYGFDSTIRSAPEDRMAFVWLPFVVVGALGLGLLGRRQSRDGVPATAWAVLLWAAVTFGTITLYVPMAWDRYFLSIQPPACLLGGFGIWLLLGVVMGGRPLAGRS